MWRNFYCNKKTFKLAILATFLLNLLNILASSQPQNWPNLIIEPDLVYVFSIEKS